MKIALDAGPLSDGNAGRGVGVYTQLLYDALKKQEEVSVEAIDVHSTKSFGSYDLVHYPSFDFFRNTLKTPNKPFVVTIHDTIPLIYPKNYPPGLKGRLALFRQKQSLKKAAAVITDSFTSKKDIIRYLNVKPERIFPIYLGPTISKITKNDSQKSVLRKFQINYPYVLYIGDVNWNKNLVSLCRACDQIGAHLVIVGKRAVSKDYDKNHIENRPLVEMQKIAKTSSFIHTIGFVDDEDLPSIVKGAQLLCQPSYYEGFGFSVLDAMSLGIPTVCAKTQALSEIYGSASIFFNPSDVADMASVIGSVLANETLQRKLQKLGLTLSKSFSWNKTASETVTVYKNVLAQK